MSAFEMESPDSSSKYEEKLQGKVALSPVSSPLISVAGVRIVRPDTLLLLIVSTFFKPDEKLTLLIPKGPSFDKTNGVEKGSLGSRA
jgi:hypothetical protein